MKRIEILRPLLLATSMAAASRVDAGVFSDFSTGREGWVVATLPDDGYRVASFTTQPDLHLLGGDPGGHISVADPDTSTFWFQAPNAFLGDRSADSGGTLSFSLKVEADSALHDFGDVVLASPTLLLVADVGANPDVGVWTSYSVSLSPSASWHVGGLDGPTPTAGQFEQVLSNLTVFRIRGEFFDGGDPETTSLDSVSFGAVPEPGAYAGVAAVALLATGVWRRTRRTAA